MRCLQLVAIGVFLQIPGCFPSCLIVGSVANCAFQNLVWVPALPPHITHLFLGMNRIGEINSSSLSGLERLQELDLGRQRVQLVIRTDAFRRQSSLRKLLIDSNVDLQLEPGAFVGLSSLQKLHLGYCSLDESILKGQVLQPLSSLETLDLFGNRIKRLQPAAFFTNMSHLTDVNLKLNPIDRMCESDLGCGNPFRGMSFQTLDLSHNGFSVNMSRRFFRAIEGTKISHLKLSGHMGRGFSFNNLPDPDRSTFAGLRNSSVLILDLSKNRIFALQRGVFSPLRDVVNIDLSQNRVNRIDRNAFEGLQGHLASLNLSHNLLGELYSDTFASLSNLRVLDLSHNHIGALGHSAFRGLPRLRVLDLTGNALRDLGFPAALPRLDHLLLRDNLLTHSSMRSVPRFAGNVVHLDVKNNRITDLANVYTFLTRLKRLQRLSYGGNSIRWCVPSAQAGPNDLQVLDLHSSSLQSVWAQGKCLNLFDKLGKVIALDLNSNALQALPQGIFKGLTSVVQMDLSSNSLTFLDLKMNRFHCDADLRGFLSWLNKTNVTFLSPARELRSEGALGPVRNLLTFTLPLSHRLRIKKTSQE
ncbi:unnamed protein product [Pleuronectes platessa]|uniref:Toll-like receptor 5L n=1 Tax=Pleuronectes platessa TaxID=8262 RepID=A0A9N7UHY0_PLEPL|nr:unnamed protein product [Pleuronectes platessa]